MRGFLVLLFMTMMACMAPSSGHATSSYMSSFNSRYGTSGTRLNSCSTCHDGSPPATNYYGDDFFNQLDLGRPTATAFANIEPIDSDGDGVANLAEIQARTFPGDPADKPATGTPALTVTPSALAFGSMQQGQTKSLTVTLGNTGNANCTVSALTKSGSADFSYGAGAPVAPFTITPGSSVVVPISYTPSNVGVDSGGLQIASNDPANPSVVVALSGTGDPVPATSNITVAPTAIAYGPVRVGQSRTLSAVIGNTGDAACTVNALGITGGDFSLGSSAPGTPFSVAPGASISIPVVYAPVGLANGIGTLVVTSTDPNNPVINVGLSGSGVLPQIGVSPTSVDFGTINIGTSAGRSVIVTNAGGAPLSVTSLVLTASAEFDYAPTAPYPPFAIEAGGATNVALVYMPIDAGADAGSLAIGCDDPITPTVTVALAAAGQAPVPVPQVQVDPVSLNFGYVAVGQTNTLKILVSNTGGAVAHIGAPVLSGSTAFTAGATAVDLAPGASNEVNVTYAPAVLAKDAASLTFTSDDPVNPSISVALLGQTGQSALSVTPTAVSFGPVITNGVVTRIVTLANAGTLQATVSGLAIVGSTEFAVDATSPAAPFVVAAGASVDLTLSYSPIDVGADTGTLNIASDDIANPNLAVALGGTGTAQALDVDISQLQVDKKYEIGGKKSKPIKIFVNVVNRSRTNDIRTISVIGVQNGVEVYSHALNAVPKPKGKGAHLPFPAYVPLAAGQIDWTATLEDNDPDTDVATATTLVTAQIADVDIAKFTVTPTYALNASKKAKPIQIQAQLKSSNKKVGAGSATVIGMQGGIQVYAATANLGAKGGKKGSMFPPFVPTAAGQIDWTITVVDEDPDIDEAMATTLVTGAPIVDDDDDDDDDDDRSGKGKRD